ncbi:MAG TPA: BsuPI-related putative proteinase inhibitor [Gemmatimonadales bacterium]|nr:BsuPI-related putative proteinase inhibitor [Gemmatimonadales bacterium]
MISGILVTLGALAAVPADSPKVELDVPSEVTAGTPVPMTLRVTNTSDRPLELHLRGRPIAFDLVVRQSDGSVVWRRLAGAMIAMVLQLRTLSPGETLELTDAWPQQRTDGSPAAPGDYTVTGSLLTDSQASLDSPPVPFRVLATRGR